MEESESVKKARKLLQDEKEKREREIARVTESREIVSINKRPPQWENLQAILNMFRNVPGAQITIFNLNGFPNGVTADCQDEPHLIATDSDEADAILDMWEGGKCLQQK
jgi:hypothetical protein